MRPFLFHIGDTGVPSFFFMVMIAALASTFFAAHIAKKEGADPVVILDFGIIGVIASVIGAKVFHVIFESPAFYFEKPMRILYFWLGGYISIGAYVFSLAGWLIYLWKKKLDTWRYLDIAAVGVPIIEFFVRIGCFLAGCCYGRPTDFIFTVVFNNPASVPAHAGLRGVPIHPTQIYFMVSAALMWVLLLLVYRYRKFKGQVVATFLMYYGFSRFLIEFTRGDKDRGFWFDGSMPTAQLAMIFAMAFGVAIWLVRRKKTVR